MLYIIPTPIGNLEDITLRALRILAEVDIILAEDTRTSRKLLFHYNIDTPMQSFHAHNEHQKVDYVINLLHDNKDIALISDAGTPSISDPGYLLSKACMNEGIKMTCLPGATALIPAIVMSGLPCDKFFFEGFLPHKKGKLTRIKYLLSLSTSFAFYESPYRILKSISMIHELSENERTVSICREISKLYEEVITLPSSKMIKHLKLKSQIKGEFVVIVEGKR